MTQRQDDFDRGLANRRAVLGDAWVERSLSSATAFNAGFQETITRDVWHGIWSRPGLDHRTRRLLVLAMTLAQGRWEEYELHVRAALTATDGSGFGVDTLEELLLQAAAYCGVPAANTGFKLAAGICKTEGIALAPSPLGAGQRVQHHRTFSEPQLLAVLQGSQTGVPVALSHALGLDHTMWDSLAAALAPDHPVLRYDHRGQGASARPPGPYRLDDLVDDAARLLREWGRGPVVFVGLSMGGMVAQGLAIRHPELVRGLVLANTTALYPPEAQAGWRARIDAVQQGGLAQIVDTVVERYLHAGFRHAQPTFAAALRQLLLGADPAAYVASCEAIRAVDWASQLGQIRCPTVVISGALDAGTTPAMGRAIADAVPGAQFELLEEASHLSVAEQPASFEAAVRALIARC